MKNIDLSPLKDAIAYSKPDFFPLAIGWWIVLFSLIVFTILLFFIVKYYLQSNPKVHAFKILNRIYSKNLTPAQMGVEISKLLKRIAIYKFGRESTASLSDTEWRIFIDNMAPSVFPNKILLFITSASWAPPQNKVAISKEDLYNSTKKWINSVFKEKNNGNKRSRYIKNSQND